MPDCVAVCGWVRGDVYGQKKGSYVSNGLPRLKAASFGEKTGFSAVSGLEIAHLVDLTHFSLVHVEGHAVYIYIYIYRERERERDALTLRGDFFLFLPLSLFPCFCL